MAEELAKPLMEFHSHIKLKGECAITPNIMHSPNTDPDDLTVSAPHQICTQSFRKAILFICTPTLHAHKMPTCILLYWHIII
jgi:hypothetical protein